MIRVPVLLAMLNLASCKLDPVQCVAFFLSKHPPCKSEPDGLCSPHRSLVCEAKHFLDPLLHPRALFRFNAGIPKSRGVALPPGEALCFGNNGQR
ncbi:hypothetical protein KC19_VG136800 [Ceratodon purpureus]|uniref:Secreted protein n=1 Tax=Ceratodon purpureus TaxID=3225 RepID=A0A8T0HQ79_CERPU|nr:hypothetical protein KC19_VG136800 [Ceratodon purpureus]